MRKARDRESENLLQGTLDLLNGAPSTAMASKSRSATTDDVLKVDHGSLYPALHRLEKQGWLDSEWKLTENKQRANITV